MAGSWGLSVCPVPREPGQDPHQPLPHLAADASLIFLPASSTAVDGQVSSLSSLRLRDWSHAPAAVVGRWWPQGLPGLPGSAVCCRGALLPCFSLAGCEEIGFITIESMFSEILQSCKRGGIISVTALQ